MRGPDLLLSDIRVALLVMNEARYRAIEGVFGVSRDQANLLTVIVLAMTLQAGHDKAVQVLRARGAPTLRDVVLGAVILREVLYGIGGPSSKDTPYFGTLVSAALMARQPGPALRRSLRGLRTAAQEARAGFKHRYGGQSRTAMSARTASANVTAAAVSQSTSSEESSS